MSIRRVWKWTSSYKIWVITSISIWSRLTVSRLIVLTIWSAISVLWIISWFFSKWWASAKVNWAIGCDILLKYFFGSGFFELLSLWNFLFRKFLSFFMNWYKDSLGFLCLRGLFKLFCCFFLHSESYVHICDNSYTIFWMSLIWLWNLDSLHRCIRSVCVSLSAISLSDSWILLICEVVVWTLFA